MPTLKVVGSSSKGNSYIVETENESIILDLGCKWNDILKSLNYKIDKVGGCLVTHVHTDHSKSIPNALKNYIPVYSCQEVAEKFDGVKLLMPKTKYKIGSFTVMPLPVEHNVENYAYLIEHEEIGKLVFCTDAISFNYKIKGLNNLLIEGNYSEELMIDNLCKNKEIRSHNEYHMEINTTIEAIKRNMNSELKTIMLVHLSDGQSDEKLFQKMVFEEVGIMPIIADKWLEISLDKFDF